MTEDIRTFQHVNKYARFRKDLNRRETWKETVDDRVMPFFRKYYGNALHDLEWGILRDALFEEQASFSMRAIQMAGPAAERCAVSLYNPVAGDTLVLTRDGYKPIRELEGKSLDVLNVENRWAPATFRGYGAQETFEVVLKSRSSTRPSIRATKEHRWVLCDGTVLPTSELKVGMRIPFAAAPRPEKNLDYYLGVRHGLVFGDGTTLKTQGRATSYAIRLCGESKELLKYFEGVPHSYPPSFDGDPVVYLCGTHATTALKDLPTEHESLSYIYGFLCGWFAADGSVSKGAGQAVLAVSERWMPWLKQNSARVGWVFMNSDVYSADTNYGKRKEPLHRVSFYAGSLLREDMLLSRKAENFKDKARTFFHVESVTATGMSEDVFCAHVPDTNTFVLNNGVVTGNCAFTPIETLEDFSEVLYILMQGTGCAFSVERQFTDKLPAAAEWYEPAILDHVVKDSTEGWCDALAFGLRAWWAGKDVYFDYSGVRPAGARLLTKGGYASGPKPLKELLDFARSIIRDAQGRKLRPLEVHRIACKIGKIVEVGGVRRAAMLSLSDLDDLEMRAAKNGEFWNEMPELTMANNSVAYGPEVDWSEFDIEWENLRAGGSGERGIFNRPAKGARGRDLTLCGTNPCVSGDTWVLTTEGPKQVKDLIGVPHTSIVQGRKYAASGFWKSGHKPVVKVTTASGYSIKVTEDHKMLTPDGFLPVNQLVVGESSLALANHQEDPVGWDGSGTLDEGWLLGSLYGDGCLNDYVANVEYWGPSRYTMQAKAQARLRASLDVKASCGTGLGKTEFHRVRIGSTGLLRLAKKMGMVDPTTGLKCLSSKLERGTSAAFHIGFLRGWFDADGSPQGSKEKGRSVRLSSVNLDGLHMAQRMLSRLGIVSKVYQNRKDAGYHLLPDGRGGQASYYCQANHELIISRTSLRQYAAVIGFDDPEKAATLDEIVGSFTRVAYRDRFESPVVAIDPAGMEDVYDCTVDQIHAFDANGLVAHNCGEVFTQPHQFCNLSIAIIRPGDSRFDIRSKVEAAAVMGTLQSGLTHFEYLRPIWRETTQAECLLGVDIMGALDNPLLQDEAFLEELRNLVISTNTKLAARLGINPSAATTCIKPGGNSGERYGTGNSISGWHARQYIRRVCVNNVDPMCQFLKDQGVPYEPKYNGEPVTVFAFLKEAPAGAIIRSDRTVQDQLEWWLKLKTHWCEHNPSTTIYVRPGEWDFVKGWVKEHWNVIAGLSFLPYDGSVYKQAPFEEVSPEVFSELKAGFPRINWNEFAYYEALYGDTTTVGQEPACMGGVCEL